MRIIQGIVKYKSQVKWTPTHVQHKRNTYRIWDIDCNDYNKTSIAIGNFKSHIYLVWRFSTINVSSSNCSMENREYILDNLGLENERKRKENKVKSNIHNSDTLSFLI